MEKRNIKYLFGALLLAAFTFTACTEDNSMTQIVIPEVGKNDEVIKALEAIPGVCNVEKRFNYEAEMKYTGSSRASEDEDTDDSSTENELDSIYFFFYVQPVDHHDPSKGTYKQFCKLRFAGFDKDVLVYTHGYDMDKKIEPKHDITTEFGTNQLNIEHRYFGSSQPEGYENIYGMTYFNADQQAHDIHNILSALRKNLFKTSKFISTGTSKDGITTALQAYYSDLNGWKDIDVYVPFCAPFIQGTKYQDGSFSCENNEIGIYLWQVCGNGYPKGSAEEIGYQRLSKIPYYICTNEEIRNVSIETLKNYYPDSYLNICNQYYEKSPYSTGDLTKDLAAACINFYYDALLQKFSYVQYNYWASMVPDPELLASGKATNEDFNNYAKFLFMESKELAREVLKNLEKIGSRSSAESYWTIIQELRKDKKIPYDIQSFMELGYIGTDYSLVDGQFLTADQCLLVNYMFTMQKRFEGLYPQDKGKLMTDFREWVKTENTMPIIFVYAYNDPWTGSGIIPERTGGNSMIVSLIDATAIHSDSFRDKDIFEPKTHQAIVESINKFLK